VKINFARAGISLAAAAATAVGFAGTTVTTHATNTVAVTCPQPGDSGTTVATNGSSLQYNGVNAVATSYNGGTPCPSGGTVQVAKGGSGVCVNEMKAHAGVITSPNTVAASFCGTDVHYTAQDHVTMSTGPGNSATPINTVPLAASAVAVSYNESCAGTGVHITGAQLSGIYSGTITDWHTIASACPAGTTIKAGVRGSASGTTATFKNYLFKSDPATWATFSQPDSSTNWPAALTKTCNGTNNTDMATCLSNGTSNIAYVDFSDAAHTGLVDAAVTNANPTDFETPAPGGCTAAATAAVTPHSTLADWSAVSITDGPTGYGICTFTYALVFQNTNSAGMGSTSQTRVLKAFLGTEVSDAGQSIFVANNYDALPANLQAMAQVAVSNLQ
jgi:ABC-type phosphate transport system substrate-binding protein